MDAEEKGLRGGQLTAQDRASKEKKFTDRVKAIVLEHKKFVSTMEFDETGKQIQAVIDGARGVGESCQRGFGYRTKLNEFTDSVNKAVAFSQFKSLALNICVFKPCTTRLKYCDILFLPINSLLFPINIFFP